MLLDILHLGGGKWKLEIRKSKLEKRKWKVADKNWYSVTRIRVSTSHAVEARRAARI